ncbi:hypothetical protein MTO96_033783 [Rhipicephalus appendiculatus]
MSAETLQTTTALEPLEDVARRELGETPAVKQAALNELRRLISDEPSLHCPMDDVFLVRFLRARKYDTQAAFKNVKKYFKVRTEHPEIFEDFTPSGIPFDDVCRKHRLATLSRHRDQMGRMAMLIKAGAWNTEISSLNDFIRVAFVIIEHILTWEDFVIRGFVIIVDLKGLSIYHLAHFTPSVTRTVFSLLQVRLFGHDLEELRQLVPDDVIPEENGGTNESYDYDQLERELQSEESYFQRLRSYGYRDTPTKTETESNGLLTDEVSGPAVANDMSAVVLEPAASLEAIEDIALRELGETPKIKQTALNELRQLISGEPSLHCPTDDAFLLKFLRARKYDTQATFKIVKKYFKVRKYHPDMFKDLTPSRIPFDAVCRKHRLVTVSRHRDPMGRMAALLKTGAWNAEICSLNDYFRVCLVLLEHFLHQEDIQVKGIVAIIDFKGLNIYHLAHYTPSAIRTAISLAQDCMPMRLKGIYVINNPPIFDFIYAVIKMFLKAKLLKRIRLFGYDLKELHQLVPDDVIPEENGGTNESYDCDPLERELESEEGYFQELNTYAYHDKPRKTDTSSVTRCSRGKNR